MQKHVCLKAKLVLPLLLEPTHKCSILYIISYEEGDGLTENKEKHRTKGNNWKAENLKQTYEGYEKKPKTQNCRSREPVKGAHMKPN